MIQTALYMEVIVIYFVHCAHTYSLLSAKISEEGLFVLGKFWREEKQQFENVFPPFVWAFSFNPDFC